jgi:site-specific recombinase XerD
MNNSLVIHDIIKTIDDLAPHQKNKSISASTDIDAIKTWLMEFANSPNTFISYRQTAERFLLWLMQNNINLTQVSRENIHNYQQFLASPIPAKFWCGPSRPRTHEEWKPFVKGLANSSIKLNLQILTTMYEYLIQSGYLVTNPFKLIKRKSARLTTVRGVERFLTHKEWQYVLNHIENMPDNTAKKQRNSSRIKWIFSLLYLSGCRRSEIINARMSDFIKRNDHWWLRVIGKGNKYGEIPVTSDLLDSLVEYRKSINLPSYPKLSENHIPIVCSIQTKTDKYTPITDSMLYKIIKQTCRYIAAELEMRDPAAAFVIEQVSTHWLRHTSATHQVDAGIDIRVVKDNLRHSLLETTMKYQHTESDARHIETNKKFGIK